MKTKEGKQNKSQKPGRGYWFTILGLLLVTGTAMFVLDGIGSALSHPALAAASVGEDMAGKVLPPMAKPFGYSLAKMAEVTAVFNTGDHQRSGSVTRRSSSTAGYTTSALTT